MQVKITKHFEDFQFSLSEYILKSYSEKEKVFIAKSLPDEALTEIVKNLDVKDIKCKIYKYNSITKLLRDYFSSDDVSGVLFKYGEYYGLNIFNIDKFLKSGEFYLYVFENYNENIISVDRMVKIISSIEEVDLFYFEKYKLVNVNEFILEITSSNFNDYVVNIIDKFYYKNVIYPFFDIHYYRIRGSVDNVNYYFLFTFHPNVSSSGSVCFGKMQKTLGNLSRLEMNFDSAYNSGIRYTSYNVNKELIKKIIEGGGLNV